MRQFTFPILLVLLHIGATAQPQIQWQRNLGGSAGDVGYGIDRTSDGGYVLIGETASLDGDVVGVHGSLHSDVWVIRLDESGTLLWQRALGGTAADVGRHIRQTADGGYVLTGLTQSNDGDVSVLNGTRDIWVVKLDASGGLVWERTIGGSGAEIGWSIEELDDGDLLLAGETTSIDAPMLDNHGADDFWLARLSGEGEIIWTRCYGGDQYDVVRDMAVLADGSVVMVGITRSSDGDVSGIHGSGPSPEPDAWVIKTTSTGEIEWQTCLGGTGNDSGWAITVAPNGKIYVGCVASSTDGQISTPLGLTDCWVVRLSSSGSLELEHSFGGSGGDGIWRMVSTRNNEIYVIGSSASSDGDVTSPHGSAEAWMIKLDPDLQLVWDRAFGGTLSDGGRGIHWSEDGSVCFVGHASSSDGDLTGNNGSSDLWVVKLEAEYVGVEDASATLPFTLSPNPATNELRISLNGIDARHVEILDVTGRRMHQQSLPIAGADPLIPISRLGSGLYTVRISNGAGVSTRRFIKE